MICDREEEISAFIPEEYWSLDAMLKAPGTKKPAAAHFHKDKDGKTEIRSRAELDALLESLKGQKFIVNDIRNGERTKKPPLPFTTKYHAAGGVQGVKLLHPEDDASRTAAL